MTDKEQNHPSSPLIDLQIPLYWILTVVATLAISIGGVYAKLNFVSQDLQEIHAVLAQQNTLITTYQVDMAVVKATQRDDEMRMNQLKEMQIDDSHRH